MENQRNVWNRYLPQSIAGSLVLLPEEIAAQIQEIRLRKNAPTVLSTPQKEWLLEREGKVNELYSERAIVCTEAELQDSVARLCEFSIHTHEEEMKEGYIHTAEGCRAGIAGRAVVENGKVTAVRDITSVCLRMARSHRGSAVELATLLRRDSTPMGTLLCGVPGCGKTSILRDLACRLSSGEGGARKRVAVVDERGELALGSALRDCDVLAGYPKPQGVLQAVRVLSPDVILLDELGGEEEVNALSAALQCGVGVVATIHADTPERLRARPSIRRLLESGAVERVVFLSGRETPGSVRRICSANEVLYETDRIAFGSDNGDTPRNICLPAIEPKSKGVNLNSGITLFPANADRVYGGTVRKTSERGAKRESVCSVCLSESCDEIPEEPTVPQSVGTGSARECGGGWIHAGGYGIASAYRK